MLASGRVWQCARLQCWEGSAPTVDRVRWARATFRSSLADCELAIPGLPIAQLKTSKTLSLNTDVGLRGFGMGSLRLRPLWKKSRKLPREAPAWSGQTEPVGRSGFGV